MSIAGMVREYILNRPCVLESLERNFANFSKLSKTIGRERNIDNYDAIKAELYRFRDKRQKEKKNREKVIQRVLGRSTIELSNGINVLVSKAPLDVKAKYALMLDDTYVYLTNKLEELPRKLEPKHQDCAVFIIRSPREVEETPGVVAYLTSILWERNINVIEFISCFTNTILVVGRSDEHRAYGILKLIVGRTKKARGLSPIALRRTRT